MNPDYFFYAEIGIVAVILLIQILVFSRNTSAIRALAKFYPKSHALSSQATAISESDGEAAVVVETVDVIEENTSFSSPFRQIVHTTNEYVRRNRGGADFEILKELAEHKDASKESAIESNIPIPLYIGLMCTFLGVIIGLIRLSMEGVTDDAITAFIGGVLIGMIGSAVGLLLTVLANNLFRESKRKRDERQYDYFTFLRTHILPVSFKDAQEPIETLRQNLAAFNEGFAQYQSHMNESLGETLRLFSELKDVFKQIRSIEQGLNGMGHFLQSNEGLIEKQVAYINSYAKKAEELSLKLGQHFSVTDEKINQLVSSNIQKLDSSSQAAYVKMDQYLASLGSRNSQEFKDQLNQDLDKIKSDVHNLQAKSLEVNNRLLTQLNQDGKSQLMLNEQVQQMNSKLQHLATRQDKSFINSGGFQLFAYTGVAAFGVGIVAGVMYLINLFGA